MFRQLGPISEFLNTEYCQDYQAILSRLAYFGLLKDEEAVCFNASSTILAGSYLLVAGAVMLALLNTFVTKAVYQYFRDKQGETARNAPLSAEDKGEVDEENGVTAGREKDEAEPDILQSIQPVAVLFTDTFRWMLRPEKIIEVDLSNNPQTLQSGLFSDYAPSQRTIIVPKKKSNGMLGNIVAEPNPEQDIVAEPNPGQDPNLSQEIFTVVPVQIDVYNRSSTSSIVSDLDDEPRSVKPKGGDIEREVRACLDNGLDEWTSESDSEEKEEKEPSLDAWTSADEWTSNEDSKDKEEKRPNLEARTFSDEWTSDNDSEEEEEGRPNLDAWTTADEWTSNEDSEEKEEKRPNLDSWTSSDEWTSDDDSEGKEGGKPNLDERISPDEWTSDDDSEEKEEK